LELLLVMLWRLTGRVLLGDFRKCQTPGASSAKPGGLLTTLEMGRKSRAKRERRRRTPVVPVPTWAAEDGVHALVPGTRPSAAELEEMTRRYQERIRHSPLWRQMVKEYGKEKAEELLRQFRAEVR
jgi:hypothetical protein